jgi:hypothetical protein
MQWAKTKHGEKASQHHTYIQSTMFRTEPAMHIANRYVPSNQINKRGASINYEQCHIKECKVELKHILKNMNKKRN